MAPDEAGDDAAKPSPPGRSGWRTAGWWILRATVIFILLLLVLASPLACTTRVIPPRVTGEAVEVMLVDHGRTPALVLPRSEGGYDRWVYGEFHWYALGRSAFYRVPAVLFWPTQGGLGRERFDPAHDLASIRRLLRAEQAFVITVAAEDARRLQAELEGIFEANRDTLVDQVQGPMQFVHHPYTYTYFANSNHRTAHWLRELGCQTRGPAFVSRWRVDSPPAAGQ